jgi:hypothetical protein
MSIKIIVTIAVVSILGLVAVQPAEAKKKTAAQKAAEKQAACESRCVAQYGGRAANRTCAYAEPGTGEYGLCLQGAEEMLQDCYLECQGY